MGTDIKPIVKKIDDNVQGLKSFHESLVQKIMKYISESLTTLFREQNSIMMSV